MTLGRTGSQTTNSHRLWELSQAGDVDPETLWAGTGGKLVQEGHPLLSTVVLHQARHVS